MQYFSLDCHMTRAIFDCLFGVVRFRINIQKDGRLGKKAAESCTQLHTLLLCSSEDKSERG